MHPGCAGDSPDAAPLATSVTDTKGTVLLTTRDLSGHYSFCCDRFCLTGDSVMAKRRGATVALEVKLEVEVVSRLQMQ